jgi:putative aldouronate transport system permease protein
VKTHLSAIWGRILKGLNIIVLIIFAFICIYPLYFIFINSISSTEAVVKGVYILPMDLSLKFYKSLLKMPNISNSIFISIARTLLGTALTVICSSFLGYMVTQRELPMRKWIYRFVIATMYFNAGLIPWYILMVNLGLKNNFLLYILPGAVSAYFVVLSKTYIESIPASVEESAKIDGAGVLAIFIRLILPMSMPIIACLIVFSAVNQWNSWADNFYLVSNPKLATLQYQLYMNLANETSNVTNTSSTSSLLRSRATTEVGLRYALSILTVLPIIIVYPFMQKYFVQGIMLGAVKG